MALSEKQTEEIREELDSCKNPLFFFDDDQDGLCAFLLLYRYKREGHGIVVKTVLGQIFSAKIEQYRPDKIFILDLAEVDQDFLESLKVPVVWIDHHGFSQKKNVKYFNPRVSNPEDNFPTSLMCYQAVRQDIWLAAIGCVADWFMPPFMNEFEAQYPELMNAEYNSPGDIIYGTQLGHLIRVFSFILKGRHHDVMKSVKILTRVKSPSEILNQENAGGRLIYKIFEHVNKSYQPLRGDFMEAAKKSGKALIVFAYQDGKGSFTSDISNEAIHTFPDKAVIIAREKNDEMKCSLRAAKINLIPIMEKCLIGLKGYGGGHEHACGLNVKKDDFEEFVRRFEEMIKPSDSGL